MLGKLIPRVLLLLSPAMPWLSPGVCPAAIVGRVVSAGFGSGESLYRVGAWLPVIVELRLEEPASHFTGVLQIEQSDRDNDLTCSERRVTLTAGGQARRFWLYTVANPRDVTHPFAVQLLDDDGAAVAVADARGGESKRMIPPRQVRPLSAEHMLVLELSARPTHHLGDLSGAESLRLKRPIEIARVGLDQVPDQWYGLEMADCLFWDGADPTNLNPGQVSALVTWVRRGGTLVLAAGTTAGTLAKSKLGQLLPVEVLGTDATYELPELARTVLKGGAGPGSPTRGRPGYYLSALTYCKMKPRPGARIVFEEDSLETALAVRGRFGHGHVTFVGAEVREIFRNRGNAPRFFGKLLELRKSGPEEESVGFIAHASLFGPMHQPIDFQETTKAYQLLAILFVIGYIILATFASWQWLKTRDWLHHSWTVFAAVVACASALSLGAVRTIHGVGQSVRQLSIIDAHPGSYAAQASCYFGLKTAAHTSLDLWLPSKHTIDEPEMPTDCFLRPLSPDEMSAQAAFVAPRRYRLRPAAAMMESVPIRATLKQLEGRWTGELAGQLEARIRIEPRHMGEKLGIKWLVTEDSYIRNGLPVPLSDCYLICSRVNPDVDVSRDDVMDVYEIERIVATDQDQTMRDLFYGPGSPQRRLPQSLAKMQRSWAQKFAAYSGWGSRERPAFEPEDYRKVLMLLTTLKEYSAQWQGRAGIGGVTLYADNVTHLDRTDAITRNTALLVGFADDPGPIRLCVRPGGKERAAFKPVHPSRATAMYRLIIPAEQ